MEVVEGKSVDDVTSIFFNGPVELIDALILTGDGLSVPTSEEVDALTSMIDETKKRPGIRPGNSLVENSFIEIHYRLLERKNALLADVRSCLGGLSDETIERLLHQICLDKVNEVMQKHKMFLHSLELLRRDLKSSPPSVPVNRSGMDFLTAYKSYEQYATKMSGFWECLKIAQGQEGTLFDFIEQLLYFLREKENDLTPPSPSQPSN